MKPKSKIQLIRNQSGIRDIDMQTRDLGDYNRIPSDLIRLNIIRSELTRVLSHVEH